MAVRLQRLPLQRHVMPGLWTCQGRLYVMTALGQWVLVTVCWGAMKSSACLLLRLLQHAASRNRTLRDQQGAGLAAQLVRGAELLLWRGYGLIL
jgi:hypothetical protein